MRIIAAAATVVTAVRLVSRASSLLRGAGGPATATAGDAVWPLVGETRSGASVWDMDPVWARYGPAPSVELRDGYAATPRTPSTSRTTPTIAASTASAASALVRSQA